MRDGGNPAYHSVRRGSERVVNRRVSITGEVTETDSGGPETAVRGDQSHGSRSLACDRSGERSTIRPGVPCVCLQVVRKKTERCQTSMIEPYNQSPGRSNFLIRSLKRRMSGRICCGDEIAPNLLHPVPITPPVRRQEPQTRAERGRSSVYRDGSWRGSSSRPAHARSGREVRIRSERPVRRGCSRDR